MWWGLMFGKWRQQMSGVSLRHNARRGVCRWRRAAFWRSVGQRACWQSTHVHDMCTTVCIPQLLSSSPLPSLRSPAGGVGDHRRRYEPKVGALFNTWITLSAVGCETFAVLIDVFVLHKTWLGCCSFISDKVHEEVMQCNADHMCVCVYQSWD